MFSRRILYGMVLITVYSTGALAQVYTRAKEVLPWIQPELVTTSYWIAKMEKPDEVILSHSRIEEMNRDYERRISSPDTFGDLPEESRPDLFYWWPGMTPFMPDFDKMDSSAAADTVRAKIKAQIDFLRSMSFGNALAIEYSSKELDDLEYNMAIDTVRDRITIRNGITVTNARLRNNTSFFPEQVGMMQTGKSRWDGWNIGIIKIGQPVSVLHTSRDGEYLLVLCDMGYGWVRAEDVAFGTRKEIEEFVNSTAFVVCTSNRVKYYTDESCTYASGWFGMSARLPLVSTNNPRLVRIPVRRVNGQFMTETAWLKENDQVHAGWVPYTRRNIVEISFRLIDSIYDWSGAWYGRQHENTYRDIFGCFGFRLPYYGVLFSFYGKDDSVMRPEIGMINQFKVILAREPFVTIQTCGSHAQLLLGEYNGTPVVFDQHGYGFVDSDSVDREIRRCNIGDMRLPPYFLTKNVTFLTLK